VAVALSSVTTEYVRVPVAAKEAGQVVNPTSFSVRFAAKAAGAEPGSGDWVFGDWEEEAGPRYLARVLVGPSGPLNPGDGNWRLWVEINAQPEKIIRDSGSLVIT
jgi:hypothetical protein